MYNFVCFFPYEEDRVMSFANRLKQCRLKKGLSLQEAADAICISKAHFWELETGKSRNPTTDLLIKISNYFSVSIGWLVGEDESTSEETEAKVLFRQLQSLDPKDVELVKMMIDQLNTRKKQ